MAYQLFTMLAKLNLLLGNIDNYNVYFYIYDFIHFTFSFIHWLDGKILKSHNDTFSAFSNAAMLNRCAGHQIRANSQQFPLFSYLRRQVTTEPT